MSTYAEAQEKLRAVEEEYGITLKSVTLGSNFDGATAEEVQKMLPGAVSHLADSMIRVGKEMRNGTLETVQWNNDD